MGRKQSGGQQRRPLSPAALILLVIVVIGLAAFEAWQARGGADLEAPAIAATSPVAALPSMSPAGLAAASPAPVQPSATATGSPTTAAATAPPQVRATATATRRVPASATLRPSQTPAPTASPASGKGSPYIPTPRAGERMALITFARLPSEAQRVIELIEAGGPFPYSQDGVTFQNRERMLPAMSGGYYKEYTVPTPGAATRGARRIVRGSAGELYYTDDHYASFRRVVP